MPAFDPVAASDAREVLPASVVYCDDSCQAAGRRRAGHRHHGTSRSLDLAKCVAITSRSWSTCAMSSARSAPQAGLRLVGRRRRRPALETAHDGALAPPHRTGLIDARGAWPGPRRTAAPLFGALLPVDDETLDAVRLDVSLNMAFVTHAQPDHVQERTVEVKQPTQHARVWCGRATAADLAAEPLPVLRSQASLRPSIPGRSHALYEDLTPPPTAEIELRAAAPRHAARRAPRLGAPEEKERRDLRRIEAPR